MNIAIANLILIDATDEKIAIEYLVNIEYDRVGYVEYNRISHVDIEYTCSVITKHKAMFYI